MRQGEYSGPFTNTEGNNNHVIYRIFRCISRDFKTEKFAPKIDLDLYTDDNFKVSKMCADFLICCSNLQIIYP